MGEVVDINIHKSSPTLSGEAICLCCKHEWVAVVPAGTIGLECPECSTLKGVMKYPCSPANGGIWMCECGNYLMYMTPNGVFCHVCGIKAEGF